VQRFASDEQGSAMVELCLVFPVLMIMVTGIFSLGIFLRQNLALTDAVNIGAKLVSINRGNTLDPCNLIYTAVVAAAPSLNPNSMTFSYTFNGTAQSGSSCSSSSSTSGPPSELVQGAPISVKVTYPCSVIVYPVNLIPNCLMAAQLTEIEQ
jgi:Flp pilus assembly protein TadG